MLLIETQPVMPVLKFSPAQAQLMGSGWHDAIRHYYQWRYGPSWRYYWLEWETNQELMF